MIFCAILRVLIILLHFFFHFSQRDCLILQIIRANLLYFSPKRLRKFIGLSTPPLMLYFEGRAYEGSRDVCSRFNMLIQPLANIH